MESSSGNRSDDSRKPEPPFADQHQPSPGLESEVDPAPRFEAPEYRAADKLQGRHALITGGDSGIGRAVAVLFAREGAQIAISYLPQEQSDAERTRRAVEQEGAQCHLFPGDISDPEFCVQLIDKAARAFGRIDILVSNAAHQERRPLEELTDAQMQRTFSTNVYAYMRLAREVLPHMQSGGVILATSSQTGLFGSKALPDYSSTKGAIDAFTKTLAMELQDRGIRVNAVAPGPVWTPLNPSDPGLPADKVARFGAGSPMGRPAQPEELAPAYVFLASNADSSYITGIVLPVTGGRTTSG